MGIFRRTVPTHYVPIHPDNVHKRDWLILLEVGTIVGPTAHNIRVANSNARVPLRFCLAKTEIRIREGPRPPDPLASGGGVLCIDESWLILSL
jgi:hypothetical protein